MSPANVLRQLAAHFNGLNIRPRDNTRPYVAQFSKGACIRYPNQNVLLISGPDREETLIVAVEPVTSDKEAKQSIAGLIDAGSCRIPRSQLTSLFSTKILTMLDAMKLNSWLSPVPR
jgi:hypothetical protein